MARVFVRESRRPKGRSGNFLHPSRLAVKPQDEDAASARPTRAARRRAWQWRGDTQKDKGLTAGSFQMSRLYSPMVRSEEKRPLWAVLRMAMRVQCSGSR